MVETTFLAGGCFWCLEAVFQRVRGVSRVQSGYMGGELAQPSYEKICSGRTGHAEVVCVHFDPAQVSFESLLEIFFAIHDPTTLNRPGHDIGSQYRSAVFAVGSQQLEQAQAFLQRLGQSGHYKDPIVTQLQLVTEAECAGQAGITSKTFWPAEADHDNYFDRNPYQGYCMAVVRPKVEKVASLFADRLA